MALNPVHSEVRLVRLGPDGARVGGPTITGQLIEYSKRTGEVVQNFSWRCGIRLIDLGGGVLECEQSGETLRVVD